MILYENFIYHLNYIIFTHIIKERKSIFKNSTFLITDFVRINNQRLIQIDDIIDDKTESTDLIKNKHEYLMCMISDLK